MQGDDSIVLVTTVRGRARPQGSINRGKGAPYPQTLRDWRSRMEQQFHEEWAGREPLRCGLDIDAVFTFNRPQGHYGTGRNSRTVRPTAPPLMVQAPDLDKLVRAVADSLTTSGVIMDDKQIVLLSAAKHWAVNVPEGVVVTVRTLGDT